MNDLTREWLDYYCECRVRGENPADSIFWRLALHTLPEGVDGDDLEVKAALEEIRLAVEARRQP